jgi:MerR family transcriptional regulator, copper efflux regulator
MNISQAARSSGLSAKAIRYYEQIQLIQPAVRGDNGYRQYDEAAVEQFRFLARARDVGFDLQECRQLLGLQQDPTRHSHQAQQLVLHKCAKLQQRIEQLTAMQHTLEAMARRCNGDEGPDCAILEDLSGAQIDETCSLLDGGEDASDCPLTREAVSSAGDRQ